jgi:serine/threonine protein phosphatase PrpC
MRYNRKIMIQSLGSTDIGLKRQRNEDYLVVNDNIGLYLVADGMGGHNAGDTASSTAAQAIESFFMRTEQERELTWPFGIDPKLSFDGNRLKTALKLANHKVWQLADSKAEYNGMGTTVVCLHVRDDIATVASVGDSRAYLVRNRRIRLLTRDDIWLNETWVRRTFSSEQLDKMPLKNVLSKAVGSKEDIEFPVQEIHLRDRDLLLLCSDGLHGLVSNDDIAQAAAEHADDLQDLCTDLIARANRAGGKDNITVAAIRYLKQQ